MTREDIIRMAREVSVKLPDGPFPARGSFNLPALLELARRAYESGAAAQREKVAAWMRNCGYATRHGDTLEDLLDHLGTQIAEGLEAEVVMEREACAKVCEAEYEGYDWADRERDGAEACAAAIRARGDK